MEPITVILSALAAAGARVGGEAVTDAYAGLKSLIVRKFGRKNPELEQHIDRYVDDQETYAKPAAEALSEVGAADDPEILELAMKALALAEEQRPGITGQIVGQINAKNVVVADQVDGGIHFGTGS